MITSTHQDIMIKNARRKFILGATAATFTAVLLLVLSINLLRLVQVQKQQEETLQNLSDISNDKDKDEKKPDGYSYGNMTENTPFQSRGKGHKRKGFKGGRGSAIMQYGGRFLVITVDSDGTTNLYSSNTDIMTDEEADRLASKILRAGKDTGYQDDYRYQIQTDDKGTKMISLLDCSEDARSLSDLWMITIAVGLFGTLVAFLFIVFTSNRAIQPLVESMEKQKRFITDAGHELKTPLSVIATNMDILTMDLGQNEWVEGTKKQVGKLRNLVTSLVYLSKMDEQGTALMIEPFSISEAAIECVELYGPVANSAGRHLLSDIENDLSVHADENSIRQIFSILMDNAIKYSRGDQVIRVRLYQKARKIFFETENDWARNIEPDKLETMFDRFTRGDRSRSNADGKNGFGLGLAIARSVAEKNNGTLTAGETREGKLRFTLIMKN